MNLWKRINLLTLLILFIRKAYKSDFMDIDHYPIFDYFEVWKIQDYNQYLVSCNSKKTEHLLLFPHNVSRVTGYKLNRCGYNGYVILGFKKPSKLVDSNSKAIIKKLWDTQISMEKAEDGQYKKIYLISFLVW